MPFKYSTKHIMYHQDFGNKLGIDYFCCGYGLVKSLIKNVYFFKLDNLLIDTGALRTRWMIPTFSGSDIPTDILVTHFHEDHTGNLAYFMRQYGAKAYGHEATVKMMRNGFAILPYEKVMFGHAEPAEMQPLPANLQFGKYSFEAHHTPGHSHDHTAYYEPNQGWLFSGDLYVADRIKVWRKTENLQEQIHSLEHLCQLDFDVLLCNHNPQWTNGKQRLQAKLEYFKWFYGRVNDCYIKGFSVSGTMKELNLKESVLLRIVTADDVAVRHMVQSVFDNVNVRSRLARPDGET